MEGKSQLHQNVWSC